jgi:hypothetical protein
LHLCYDTAMRPRRQFVYLSAATLLAVIVERTLRRPGDTPTASPAASSPAATPQGEATQTVAQEHASASIWLPFAQVGQPPRAPAQLSEPATAPASAHSQIYLPAVGNNFNPIDPPLLGRPSGGAQQAVDWLVARAAGYTPGDITGIVARYAEFGGAAGIDWFLALAQLAHETASLASWWSQRPRRNPAGIGVTGQVQSGTPDSPPGAGWTWDGAQWREGLSFASWPDDAIPAHLGRLLAYALTDEQANQTQRALIARALAYRPLPDSYRGTAPALSGLNGRWAVPGTYYGQSIAALARRMRG